MNQEHLMHPKMKDQQDWIVWAKLIFGGAGAINPHNELLSQRLRMFVMLVTYFVIIKIFLRNNNMKNKMILLMMMIMLLMMIETIPMSSLMLNWRWKIHNT